MVILGVDPGLASFGWAVTDVVRDGSLAVIELGVFRTTKSATKRNVLAADDTVRRARELDQRLVELIERHGVPAVICAESMSFPRSASAAAKMAVTWGLICALANDCDAPIAQCSPQALKKALTGSSSSSKTDVQQALEVRFGNRELLAHLGKTIREHAADALGAIVACSGHEAMRMARRMATEVA